MGFEPLYKSVPQAALRDSKFYQLLALVDAIRDGRARERKVAERDLVRTLDRQLKICGEEYRRRHPK